MSCKISVIMPVYNAEDTIGAAIDSVLNQEGCEFELVVVDDGSTDGSAKIMKEKTAGKSNVICKTIPHTGAYEARNQGMKAAGGRYFYFADADDLVEPGALKLMSEKMDATGADLLTCGFRQVKRKDGQVKLITAPAGEFTGDQVREDFTHYNADSECKVLGSCFNKVFRSGLIESHPDITFPALLRNEEEVFIMRYLKHCGKIVNIPDVVYTFYPIDMQRSRLRLPEDFGEEVEKFRKIRLEFADEFGCNNEKSRSFIAAEYWGKMVLALKLCFKAGGSIDKAGKEKFERLAKMLMNGLKETGSVPKKVTSSKIYMLLNTKMYMLAREMMKKSV